MSGPLAGQAGSVPPLDMRFNLQYEHPGNMPNGQMSGGGMLTSPAPPHAQIGSLPPRSPLSFNQPTGKGPAPHRPPLTQDSSSFHGSTDAMTAIAEQQRAGNIDGGSANSAPPSAGVNLPPPPYRQSPVGVSPTVQNPQTGFTTGPDGMGPRGPSVMGIRPMPPTPAQGLRPDALLGAHLAAIGAGPITASAAGVGPGLARLTALSEALSVALEVSTMEALRAVVANFFTDTAVLKYGLFDPVAQLNKVFEIPCAAFPRFQHIGSLSGVIATSISPHYVREFVLTAPHPAHGRPIHVGYLLRADEAVWQSKYMDGAKVDLVGTLTAHFVLTAQPGGGVGGGTSLAPPLRIESLDFDSRGHEEWVSRDAFVAEKVERLYDLPGYSYDEDEPAANHASSRTKTRKASGGNAGVLTRRRSGAGGKLGDSEDHASPTRGHNLPKSASLPTERYPGLGSVSYQNVLAPSSKIGSFGITEMGMRCLEIAESVAQLHELIGFSLENDLKSLTKYSELHRSGSLPDFPQAGQPPGMTPIYTMQQGQQAAATARAWPASPQSATFPTPTLPPASIAQTSQHPSHNTFYASSTVPPPPSNVGMPPLPPLVNTASPAQGMDQSAFHARSIAPNMASMGDASFNAYLGGQSPNKKDSASHQNDANAPAGPGRR
ncbi:hypothetical protein OIV83_000327 [Microbotryomycetes sp. JL201]|nr:hypothetical protein OIV83_000327 [Microbotryomycetes sp. JL201]